MNGGINSAISSLASATSKAGAGFRRACSDWSRAGRQQVDDVSQDGRASPPDRAPQRGERRLEVIGWEVPDAATLHAVAQRLENAGVRVRSARATRRTSAAWSS